METHRASMSRRPDASAPAAGTASSGPRDRAEIRHDDLEVAHRAVEEDLAHEGIRGLVAEQAGAGNRGALDAGAAEQLAPAAGALGMGDIDGLGIEAQLARAQARDGDEAGAVGDLDEKVLAFLGGHGDLRWWFGGG